ncbi:MAG: DUF4062 domain-containing protein [Sphingomonadaceae bacterium]
MSPIDKRYQVFVSSTYADLQEERQEVMQALLELDCMPAGMELFPAANEDQWTLIKRVIDDCDYYIVIIAGRYGSIGPDGISYTEMEYRYALDTGKPVIGFIHKEPGALPAKRCEDSEEGRRKLALFCDLVKKKACRFWDSPEDLGGQVSRSLIRLMKDHPAIGWVRGNLVPDQSAAEELLALRRQIEHLENQLQEARLSAPEGTAILAQGLDKFAIHFSFQAYKGRRIDAKYYTHSTYVTWDEIFAAVSPLMIDEASEAVIVQSLSILARDSSLEELRGQKGFRDYTLTDFNISQDDFQTTKVQLRALGLITKSTKSRSVKDTSTYWTLTPYGDTVMTRLRAIRRQDTSGTP